MDRFDPIVALGVLAMSIGLIALIRAATRKADRSEYIGALFFFELGLFVFVAKWVPTDTGWGWAALLLFGGNMLLTLGVWIRALRAPNRASSY